MAACTAPDGSTVTYGYDTLNRLTSLTDSLTGQFGFGYDALSRRTSLTRPNGISTTYIYDALSNLQSILHKLGVNTLDGATYTYDSARTRTSKTNLLNGSVSNFAYDNIYQLTGVTGSNPEPYSYDPVGNRLASQNVASYTYNSSNQMTAAGSATYTYDNNGNTLAKTDASGTTTYNWDFENRLRSVQPPGSTTVTFKYDPFGRRIQKGSSIYLYEGANLIEEADGSGTEVARYVFGPGADEPLAAFQGASTEFYEADGLGSITSVSANTGLITDTFLYDSFGNLASGTGAFSEPFRFTGREWDAETGLYYYRARYYDPVTGRFLNEDRLRFREGTDFYVYVRNNPVKNIDPTGLIHQAWNEPPFDGRLHDDPGAGLEVLCTKGRNVTQDIEMLSHSIFVRSEEIVLLGKDADAGHIDRLDAEIETLKRCHDECDKDKKPDPDTEPFQVPPGWLNWLEDRWDELKHWKPPQQTTPWGPLPFPPPVPVFP